MALQPHVRQGSSLLHQLGEEMLCNFHDMPNRAFNGEITTDPVIETFNLSPTFKSMQEHIMECIYFSGLIMAGNVDYMHRSDEMPPPITIRCCCGTEWHLPGTIWTTKLMGKSIDEIIMLVNYEYLNLTRGSVEDKVIKKCQEQEQIRALGIKDDLKIVRAKIKDPLMGIEIL